MDDSGLRYIKKFAFLITISFLFAFALCRIEVKAEEEPVRRTDISEEDFRGSGSKYDPYIVDSYESLCLLRDLVDSGNGLSGKYILQATDISFPDGEKWNGIGDIEKGKSFSGIYNGDGYTINNMQCEEKYAGLFTFLDGEVRNVGIESGLISGTFVGSITSQGTEKAKILNCYNKATVQGNERAGGITDSCPATIRFCWNFGNVIGTSETVVTAGIASYGDAIISNCHVMNADKIVDEKTFFGSCEDSSLIIPTGLEDAIDQYYCSIADIFRIYGENKYSINESPRVDRIANELRIEEGEVVFLQNLDGNIHFVRGYEPDIFSEVRAYIEESNRFAGKGTEEEPYLITSLDDLVRFEKMVNDGYTFKEMYFRQIADIDCVSVDNWIPIGIYGSTDAFEGIYDGYGCAIKNLSIYSQYASLFGQLSGTIMNLKLEGGNIRGDFAAAFTCNGLSSETSILNCVSDLKIEGKERAGGIADSFPGRIVNCYSASDLYGKYTDEIHVGNIGLNIYNVGIKEEWDEDRLLYYTRIEAPKEAATALNHNLSFAGGVVNIPTKKLFAWRELDGRVVAVTKESYRLFENIFVIRLVEILYGICGGLGLCCFLWKKSGSKVITLRKGNIELLRFLFAVSIVSLHTTAPNGGSPATQGGYLGVDFFALITGYFLTEQISKESTGGKDQTDIFSRSGRVIFRRVKKIFPYYFMGTIVGTIVYGFTIGKTPKEWFLSTLLALCDLGFLQNFFFSVLSATGIVWYLSALFIALWILCPVLLRYGENYRKYFALPLGLLLMGLVLKAQGNMLANSPMAYIENIFNEGVMRIFAMLSIGQFVYFVLETIEKYSLNKLGKIILSLIEISCYVIIALYIFIWKEMFDGYYDSIMIVLLVIAVILSLSQQTFSSLLNLKVFGMLGALSVPLFINHAYWSCNMDVIAIKSGLLMSENQKIGIVLVLSMAMSIIAMEVHYFIGGMIGKSMTLLIHNNTKIHG